MTDSAPPPTPQRPPGDGVDQAGANIGANSRSARRITVAALAVVGLLLVTVGAYVALGGKGQGGGVAPPLLPDSGSAPDGGPTGYLALTGTASPASVGHFPDAPLSEEPAFRDSAVAFLGTAPGQTDQTGESRDDGLVVPWGLATENPTGVSNGLGPCARNRVIVVIDTAAMPEKMTSSVAYLNAFFDWDRNGRWEGNDGCADEWGVRNQRIDLTTSGRKHGIAVPVEFNAGRQTLDFWYRITFSVDDVLNGPVPESTLKYGEIEDSHFVDPGIRRLVSASPAPSSDGEDACPGEIPTTLRANTRSLIKAASGSPGSRPNVEFASVAPSGEEGSGAKAGEVRSTLGIAPARSSSWLELTIPDQPGARKGTLSFESAGQRRRCTFWQLGEDAFAAGPLGAIGAPRASAKPSTGQSSPGSGGGGGGSNLFCPYREVSGGETTGIFIQDFAPAPSTTSGLTVATQPSDSTATAASGRIEIVAAVPPKSALSTWQVEIPPSSEGAERVQVNCTSTVIGKLPPRQQQLGDDSGGAASPGPRDSASPSITFGSYKVRFSKKSDSCGRFAFREDDTIQVRPAPKGQIEISRPATGNKSVGNLSGNDNSFLATGSGQRKDGASYVEQYQGRFAGPNVSGSYELQQGECRATFSFEGTKS